MSTSHAEDRNAYVTLGRLCVLRDRGYPEETIAEKLGFPNADVLHQQLRDWDLPGWIVGHDPAANATEKKDRTKSRSRSRTLGPSRELPPASNATPLFRERLEALLEDAELLKHMDEDLRGKYFVRTDVRVSRPPGRCPSCRTGHGAHPPDPSRPAPRGVTPSPR
jgi:hypothetical protein